MRFINTPHTQKKHLNSLIKNTSLNIFKEKTVCNTNLCNKQRKNQSNPWYTSSDFKHKRLLSKLTLEYEKISRIGPWYYNPFEKNAPIGFISTQTADKYGSSNIVEGTFINDVFINDVISEKTNMQVYGNI